MHEFNYVMPYTVRVADINYGGHVSNAVVLNYFQDARIGYLAVLGDFTELEIGGCGVILPEAHLRYRGEMFLGDQLTIGVRCKELRKSAFILEYRIERGGEVTVEGTTNLVAYDYQNRRPVRLPEPFRQAIENFEGGRV